MPTSDPEAKNYRWAFFGSKKKNQTMTEHAHLIIPSVMNTVGVFKSACGLHRSYIPKVASIKLPKVCMKCWNYLLKNIDNTDMEKPIRDYMCVICQKWCNCQYDLVEAKSGGSVVVCHRCQESKIQPVLNFLTGACGLDVPTLKMRTGGKFDV